MSDAVSAPILSALVLLASLSLIAPAAAPAGERHAGTVLAVDPQALTLTVDEFGAGAERRALRVRVPPKAIVLLSERNPASREVRDAFRDRTIALADVRIGDFVVIELSEEPEVARLVMVTLRGAGGS